jgi:glutamine amidotransferase
LLQKKTIQILDYGSGNLFSIQNSIERASKGKVKAIVRSNFQETNDGLILPGVGSFSFAQRILEQNREQIIGAIKDSSLPLLGICLGMQLLFEKSEEGPGNGLNLFKGNVERFREDAKTKVPHIGWNTFRLVGGKTKASSKFCKGLAEESWAYYVHSYFPKPKDDSVVKAWTKYGKNEFPAIIERENIFGTQFHPEKSGAAGLKLISNFVDYVVKGSKK